MTKLTTIKRIGMFRDVTSLKFRRKEETKPIFSVIATILTVVIAGAFLYLFSADMARRATPTVSQYTLIGGADNDKFEFSRDTLPVAFGVKLDLPEPENWRKYYTLQAYYHDAQSNTYPLEVEDCTEEFGSNEFRYTCIREQQLSVESLLITTQTSVQVVIGTCQNKTSSEIACATPEKIGAVLLVASYVISYHNNVVDPMSYETPIQKSPKKAMTSVAIATNRIYDASYFTYDLMAIEFNDDKGWLTSQKNKTTLLNVGTIRPEISLPFPDALAVIAMTLDSDKLIYYRRYDNILTNIARVSSMLGICITIFVILGIASAKDQIIRVLIDELLNVHIKNMESTPTKRSKKKEAKL